MSLRRRRESDSTARQRDRSSLRISSASTSRPAATSASDCRKASCSAARSASSSQLPGSSGSSSISVPSGRSLGSDLLAHAPGGQSEGKCTRLQSRVCNILAIQGREKTCCTVYGRGDNRLFAAAHMLPRPRCGSKSLAKVPELGGGSARTVGQSYGTDHLHER